MNAPPDRLGRAGSLPLVPRQALDAGMMERIAIGGDRKHIRAGDTMTTPLQGWDETYAATVPARWDVGRPL